MYLGVVEVVRVAGCIVAVGVLVSSFYLRLMTDACEWGPSSVRTVAYGEQCSVKSYARPRVGVRTVAYEDRRM